ncbi:MAG: glycosyltransferase family 2 protein [Patescibacteria group bacterium]|jgi:cellulose synthase/poly-beta-1,6-N-acetylglucosamine synthase-like glycosyltransferase
MSFLKKHRHLVIRFLEILPGLASWNLILFLFWGSFFFPLAVAYLILFYDIYWLYQSAVFGVGAVMGHYKMEASKITDWLGEAKGFGDWKRVHHIVMVVTYKEPLHVLKRTLKAIAQQDFPLENITVVLATEAKEEAKARQRKVGALKKEFGDKFGHFLVTVHELQSGEVAGKSSNERWAAQKAKKYLVDENGYDINYLTISSCDADHVYHPKYFSALAYHFLDNPKRYLRFWQPVVLFYNNFWNLPALTRISNTFSSIRHISLSVHSYRVVSCANYSTSLRLVDEVGYWDPDVIPEDYRIFFKAYFDKQGQVEVDPISLPVLVDAAESTSTWKTLINQYEQYKRWAWGVVDDAYIIYRYLTSGSISFWNKTVRVLHVLRDHFLWPVHWFVVTLGVNIPALINPQFTKSSMGYMMANFSSAILSLTLLSLAMALWVNGKQRPQRPKSVSRLRALLIPFEFFLMPISGFFFGALPGIDAHTRLMLGKYLEYRVTEKV